MKLFVDSNIVIDFLVMREPHYYSALKLFMLGKLGVVELWFSTAQAYDVYYVLSEGGKPSLTRQFKSDFKKLREALRLCSLSETDFDSALDSPWEDFEDACVYQCALKIKADAIITRNKKDFLRSSLNVFTCDEFFDYLRTEKDLTFEFIDF